MNRKRIPIMAALCVLALVAFGCHKEETYNNSTTDTSMTSVSTTDTSSTTTTVDTTGTTATGTSTSTSGGVSTLTDEEKNFMTKAAQGGIAEVNGGSMAAQKGSSGDVKNFGNQMVSDHGKANDELKTLATNKGISLPADTDEQHKKKADELSKKSGAAFDKAYMKDMVEDHEHDVAEFKKAQSSAKDPDLKAWLDKTLPVIEGHLKMAQDINKKLK
jgi:putative membrane protein